MKVSRLHSLSTLSRLLLASSYYPLPAIYLASRPICLSQLSTFSCLLPAIDSKVEAIHSELSTLSGPFSAVHTQSSTDSHQPSCHSQLSASHTLPAIHIKLFSNHPAIHSQLFTQSSTTSHSFTAILFHPNFELCSFFHNKKMY